MNASSDRFRRVDAIFDTVLDAPTEERMAVLERACGDDGELRAEVLGLLHALESADAFLETPAIRIAAPLLTTGAAQASVPERLGPFRVGREIGRGGMGRVFIAERADGQFDQRVAIKLIQHGAPGLVRRFVEERRILARLEHPGIARLIDGGLTPDGVPYFALELVDGEPIDRYCTARELSIDRRLALFAAVCDVVAYAHRQLVIHRDLKPSNILVTADGAVKLLDFGIAKLLADEDHDSAAGTTVLLATPDFAAPEQILGGAVGTATDVYALGVLLYMLLADERPYDVRGRTPAEVERLVCEVEPQRPSVRAPAAQRRRIEGDLDTIVMKALRKDPSQRYGSAQELADDVRRHLVGRPVAARPQTVRYRAGRFVARHRLAVAALVVLVVLAAAWVAGMVRQQRAIERALAGVTTEAEKTEQVTAFVLGLFQASDRGQAFSDTVRAREVLQRGLALARAPGSQPAARAQMLDAVGHIHMQLGEHDAARAVFEEALAMRRGAVSEDHLDVASSLANIAAAEHHAGRHEAAIAYRARAIELRRRLLGHDDVQTLDMLYWQASDLHESGRTRDAWPLFDEWMAGVARLPAELTATRAGQYGRLAQFLLYRGDTERALQFAQQTLDLRLQLHGERHASVAGVLDLLATIHNQRGDHVAAEEVGRRALDIARSLYPDGHPNLSNALRGLAITLQRQRRYPEALTLYREQLALVARFYGTEHMYYAAGTEDIGMVLYRQGEYAEAERHLRTAAQVYGAAAGAESLMAQRAGTVLGDALRAQGRYTEAEPLLLRGYATFGSRRVPGFDYAFTIARDGLASLYEATGRNAEAAQVRANRR